MRLIDELIVDGCTSVLDTLLAATLFNNQCLNGQFTEPCWDDFDAIEVHPVAFYRPDDDAKGEHRLAEQCINGEEPDAWSVYGHYRSDLPDAELCGVTCITDAPTKEVAELVATLFRAKLTHVHTNP